MELGAAFRMQATACGRLGSPMYADLLARVADDVGAGGPAAEVLMGHEDDSGPSALALRFMGSVHRLVLERRVGALAASYPSVGGTWEPEPAWTAFRTLLADDPDAVREWLDRPPQTNEVGRTTALMAGLLQLACEHHMPMRLCEIGSSGGLNLLADRYRYVAADGRVYGPEASPVVLEPAWVGDIPLGGPAPRITERLGSDVMPIDVRTTEGRLSLTAYIWPDQIARHERLRGALALARQEPYVVVRRQGAADFAASMRLAPGAVTVLWHSVMWQYLEPAEQERTRARLDELGASASPEAPFAHLFLEPSRRTPGSDHEFLVVLESWPAGCRRILGRSRAHGVPTDWLGGARRAKNRR